MLWLSPIWYVKPYIVRISTFSNFTQSMVQIAIFLRWRPSFFGHINFEGKGFPIPLPLQIFIDMKINDLTNSNLHQDLSLENNFEHDLF